MVTSPRGGLRILTITEIFRSAADGAWYWRTRAANGRVIGDDCHNAYRDHLEAASGFLAQQGVDAAALQQYSRLYQVGESQYHIRKYAHAAPEPWGVI